MKKKTKLLLFLLIVSITSCLISLSFSHDINVSAAENWNYENDLCGTYTITSKNEFYLNNGFNIEDGKVSTNNENAPNIIFSDVYNVPKANQRFIFQPIDSIEGKTVYYITSALDNYGKLNVKNDQYVDNQPICFYMDSENESINNPSQKWYVRTNNEGQTQIVLVHNTSFVLAIGENNNIVLSSTNNNINTRWALNPICGTYGINTHTYRLKRSDDTNSANKDTDYDISNATECFRFLENPLDGDSVSRLSDIISVGVHGNDIKKTLYNNTLAFSIPYYSKLFIDTSFVYAHSDYDEWETNLILGINDDSKKPKWKLSNDTLEFTATSDNSTREVKNGLLVIEVSSDNVNWEDYLMFNYTSSRKQDEWELDGDLLSKGTYVRVSYRFEIYTAWDGGKAWRHINEVSDSFYVAPDGFGSDDLAPITINNLSYQVNDSYNLEGFTQENIRYAETLVDGSMTLSGFLLNCQFPSYKIEISKNDAEFEYVTFGNMFTEEGKYTIRCTTSFGTQKEITIYICKSDLTETYFGNPFGNDINDVAFIQGTRILGGTNSELQDLGISCTYSWADVPVYEKGCTYNIKETSYVSSLIGTVSYNGPKGENTITINPSKDAVTNTLTEAGYYSAILTTSNNIGDIITFKFNWWVIDNAVGPEINKNLLYNHTHESYDLIPVYYSVATEQGAFTYEENDEIVEKRGKLYFAFADYYSALEFALRVEKEYSKRINNEDNKFYYLNADNPNLALNEYELFQQMYRNAKENVNINYFSNSNEFTMRGLKGNVKISHDGYSYEYENCVIMGEHITLGAIVALNETERAALTSRQPLLNNYSFISIPLDSKSVTLVSSKGIKYNIEYDIPVGEQLSLMHAESGIYTVIEETCFGDRAIYDAYYISPNSSNSITVTMDIGEEKTSIISENDSEKTFIVNDKFSIISAENPYDKHNLICVTYNREQIPLDTATLSNYEFSNKGTYEIKVEDRIGNYYIFYVKIQ